MEQEKLLNDYASMQMRSSSFESKIETRDSRIETLNTTLEDMKRQLELAQQQATEAANKDGGQGAADAAAVYEAKINEQQARIRELESNLESKVNELAALVLSSNKELEIEKTKIKDRGFPDRITKKWLESELQIKYSAEKKAAARRRHVFIEKSEFTFISNELKTANNQTELANNTINELKTEKKDLAKAHKKLGKAHDELVERLAEQKEDNVSLVEKQAKVVAGLKADVTVLNDSGQQMETKIRRLQQEVRLAKLGVGREENSLVLANSMGNNVMVGGAGMETPQQGNDNPSMFGTQQTFGFRTPQANFGNNNAQTSRQQMAHLMGAQQRRQQQKQNIMGNSSPMAMFREYLKFQQMANKWSS